MYFAANEVKRKKQVTVFFNLIGRETYSLLRNLISPVKLVEKSPEELMDVLREHFEPKKVIVASCYQFHQRRQQSGESVPIYLAELRKKAVPCEFGAALNQSLRDCLVCGLRSEAHQKRLLSEPGLTLDKPLVIAQNSRGYCTKPAGERSSFAAIVSRHSNSGVTISVLEAREDCTS